MNRRRFLRAGAASGALAVGAGGYLFLHREQARAAATTRMLDAALPPLAGNALRELNTLPARAREEVKRYFHGKCLNVEGFVTRVCSDGFRDGLGRCRTDAERDARFLVAFCGRVATETEILNQVETIAADLGAELDAAWAGYCAELSTAWGACIRSYGGTPAADELTERLSGFIRAELAEAARLAASEDQAPALGQTVEKIGQSSVLLLPLVRLGPAGTAVALPLFVVLAAHHLWDYLATQLEDRRGDYQAAISSRLALLGNRVGAEFEREVRRRLADLHTWQEGSVRAAAQLLAEERIGLI
jgi:hypothetical protein